MGGEKLAIASTLFLLLGSPPRGRGKDKAEHLVQDHIGITPAQAGKRCYLCASTKSSWDHPRVGGEKAKITPRLKRCRGSPPRGRGKVTDKRLIDAMEGITPAWAGKSPTYSGCVLLARDHPRVGGEKMRASPRRTYLLGSPPRGRGKEYAPMCQRTAMRITPAWAGKRTTPPQPACAIWDHPRVGGEKGDHPVPCRPFRGSPPRGRGKVSCLFPPWPLNGITPAWAGKRVGDM